MWHYNKLVLQTFASHDTQNAWANIESLGWRKVKKDEMPFLINENLIFQNSRDGQRLQITSMM